MNVERMVQEFVEHAEQDRTDGVGRMLARRVRRAGRTPAPIAWALGWLLAGALVGWWLTR